MALLSKSFKLSKTDSTDKVTKFLREALGYKAHLFDDFEVNILEKDVIQINLLYRDYSEEPIDSIAPRKGAIFTTDILSSEFDARILFNDRIDPNSIQSGSFVVDGTGIDTSSIYFPPGYNNYYVKLGLTGFVTEDYHEFRIDSSKIKRFDGSFFDYSPVGGYVLHNQSSAHLGDVSVPLSDRIRGYLNLGVVKTNKSYSIDRSVTEILVKYNLNREQILSYKSVEVYNNLYIYFIYVSPQEPQILEGFPLNNSLFPDVSAPSYVTLIFSTELSRNDINTTSYFAIDSGYNTITDINVSDIELFSDNRTVRLNLSSYFANQRVYSILVKPGLTTSKGFPKEKPEQWVLQVNKYEGASLTGVAGVTRLNNFTGEITIEGLGNVNINNSSNTISISGSAVDDSILTGHTGQTGIHYTLDQISITESQISDFKQYVELSVFTGHTGQTGIHYTMDQISITSSQISDLGNFVSTDDFTGHTGQTGIHYTMDQISITESQISDLGTYTELTLFTGHSGDTSLHFTEASIDHTQIQNIGTNTHAQIDSHIASNSNPHNVTASQVGALSSGEFTGHTGQTGIHFTEDQINHSVLQNLTVDTHTQYILVDGTRAFSGPVSGVTPTQDAHLATKQYVDDIVLPTPVEDLNDLNDVTTTVSRTGVFLYNFTGIWEEVYVSGGTGIELVEAGDVITINSTSVGNFTGLNDTPNLYSGQSGKYLKVNNGESGLAFTEIEVSDLSGSTIANLASGHVFLYNGIGWLNEYLCLGNLHDVNNNATTENDIMLYNDSLGIFEFWSSDYYKSGVLQLNNVENTALSTWPGSTNLTILGTVTGGTWNASSIEDVYLTESYSLADGTRPFTGPVSGSTPTENAHLATKLYVDQNVSNVLIDNPTSSSDNSIVAGGDIVPLSITADIAQTNNLFRVFNSVAQKNFFIGSDAKPYAIDATSYSGLITYNQFTGHTGASDPHTAYLLADGSRVMGGTLDMNSNLVSNVANPVGLGDAINLGYLAGIVGLYMARANSLSDVQSVPDARNNLGLGTAAVEDVGTLAISGEQITSSGASNGQVLTADGAGGSSWEDAAAGGSSTFNVMHFLMTGSEDIGGVNTNQFVINWGEVFESGTAFLPSGDTGIQVLESGRYVISAAVGWQNQGSNRIGYLGYVRKNGTEDIKRCTSRNYSRGAGYSDGSNTVYTELVLASGDFVEVVLEVDDVDSAGYVVLTITGQSEFFMRKL